MSIQSGERQVLIHGMVLVLTGLVWGLVVPHTPHPRLVLGAHIQFISNGILLIVLAVLLLKIPHRIGQKSVLVMVLAAWLTWPMTLSEAANACWGTTQMLPIVASQAGVTGGQAWQELLVKVSHIAAGIGLIVAWVLLLAGFVKTQISTESNNG
jgi:hydroxylaminobenzene mutase